MSLRRWLAIMHQRAIIAARMRPACSVVRIRARVTLAVVAMALRSTVRRGRESDRAGFGGFVAWAELQPICDPEGQLGERDAASCHRIAVVAFF